MNKKGFTLIELLAVIVILAIIALIAVPIILNIVNSAKESANERSVENYITAAKQALLTYQMDNPYYNADKTYYIMSNGDLCDTELVNNACPSTTIKVSVDGATATSGTLTLNRDEETNQFNVTISKLTLQGVSETTKYKYEKGTVTIDDTPAQPTYTQVYKPQYYGDYSFSGTVGSTSAPANPSTEPPTGKSFYLGYDVADGKVSVGYVCFVRNEKEYCLKGYDTAAYATNQDVIADAYSEVVDTACSFDGGSSGCSAGGLDAYAYSYGHVYADVDDAVCSVNVDGYFGCDEF